VASSIIEDKQREAFGRTEPFTVDQMAESLRDRLLIDQDLPTSGPASLGTDALEPSENWPKRDSYLEANRVGRPTEGPIPADRVDTLALNLNEALQVAARNSREYQTQKELVFRSALDLDLERDAFRGFFSAPIEGDVVSDGLGNDAVANSALSAVGGLSQQFQNGTRLTGRIAVDLAQLLTQQGGSSLGLLTDISVEVPLLRGAGRWIVAEPLTQAERDALYAIYAFERFKRTFAVDIATRYLGVLRQLDQVDNAEENYRRNVTSSRRAQALANEGRLPEIQVDQALQDELRARNGWISAQQNYAAALDSLKNRLGLPTDAEVILDRQTLERLASAVRAVLPALAEPSDEENDAVDVPPADAPIVLSPPSLEDRGPLEMDPGPAIRLALENRLDLRVAEGGVYDSMRGVSIAANSFLPELTLGGGGSFGERRGVGSALSDDAAVSFDRGTYNALLRVDLPLERTAERNDYRNELIDLERSVRNLQALEDSIKLDVRNQLRDMLESRESLRIQAQAVALAERRVDSTSLLLKLGRAEIRDVLEAQEALLSAQNALTSALVNYRVSELQLQSNLGLLEVDASGLWKEYRPENKSAAPSPAS
jgi:outer membrane protein TolC